MPYAAGFKAQMVKKLLGPPAITAQSLSKQVGVPQPTLSKWLREAATVGRMGSDEQKLEAILRKRGVPIAVSAIVFGRESKEPGAAGAGIQARERSAGRGLRGLEILIGPS